ncbi:MAG: hypothetical protein ACYCUG_10380, partial [Acidimicrobiales bacterium]
MRTGYALGVLVAGGTVTVFALGSSLAPGAGPLPAPVNILPAVSSSAAPALSPGLHLAVGQEPVEPVEASQPVISITGHGASTVAAIS